MNNSRVILALDVTDCGRALEIVSQASPYIAFVKIGWPIVLACGPEIITEISKMAHVICDFKVADIPNTARIIIEEAAKRGAGGIIVHGFTGSDSLEASVSAGHASGVRVFVVSEMSHPGGKEFTAIHAEEIVKMAVKHGADGIIAPATRPERLAEMRSLAGNLLILSPGVGAQGGSAGDSIRAGADYIIVGRGIYLAENPAEAAKKYFEDSLAVYSAAQRADKNL